VNAPVTRSHYQAVVDLFPFEGERLYAYALLKFSYRIEDTRCIPIAPAALFHDVRDPKLEPRWERGSDFLPQKLLTDVAVRGSAFALGGRPVPSRRVSVSVGNRRKEIEVLGDRRLEWKRGVPTVSSPEPFSEVPMDWDVAYGGWDCRVPVSAPDTVETAVRLGLDHPGVYPRNPYGRGYVVVDEPVAEGITLPRLEDPHHRLTAKTLIVQDPRRWHMQPMPACFEFAPAMMFHRFCWLGAEAWYHPTPGTPLAEVEAGALPTNFHELVAIDPMVDPAPPQFYQEAAMGLSFPPLHAETPIVVQGMNAERDAIGFALPRPPAVAFTVEGHTMWLPSQLINVLVEPAKPEVHLTYVVRREELPRVFIPGVHVKIPMSIQVNGDAPVHYDPPPSSYAELKKARAKGLPPAGRSGLPR
jgi:hypothetical protein